MVKVADFEICKLVDTLMYYANYGPLPSFFSFTVGSGLSSNGALKYVCGFNVSMWSLLIPQLGLFVCLTFQSICFYIREANRGLKTWFLFG